MDGPVARMWVLTGKLHPLVVHFPIALLAAAVLFEFIRLRRGRSDPAQAAVACSGLGFLTAALALAAGWSSAERADPGPGLEVHRWVAVAAAALSFPAFAAALLARARPGPRALAWYRFAAVAAALAVSAAAHFGGELVWGRGYLGAALKEAIWAPDPAQPGAPNPAPGAAVDFAKDVFPILSRRCFACHAGQDRKSGLTLDSREAILKGGESGEPAMIPGNGAQSLLVRLVSGEDPDRKMPPRGERLTAEQIDALKRWIDHGAAWGDLKAGDDKSAADKPHWHWAYQPPKPPAAPTLRDTTWSAGDLDRLVLARIEEAGLKPSPEADRETLIRRVSLDLIGLPPTPEEVDAFAADKSPDAYEKLVDRLLASPRYGERWARPWLDLARYADTNGYEKDGRRVMWPYRDWVIDAYNRDLPFDRFTIEQLAGDMLPDAGVAQLIATGFHRNTPINEEGGTDPEEFRVDAVMDRVNTTASVWLGATLACAQCHDHKYDPLPQKDYYRFFAFFNQDEPDAVVVNATATEKRAAGPMTAAPALTDLPAFETARRDQKRLDAEFKRRLDDLAKPGSDFERRLAAPADPAWAVPYVRSLHAGEGALLSASDDGWIVAAGANPPTSTYTVELARQNPGQVSALRLDTAPEPTTPSTHSGRSPHGNFVVSEIRVEVVRADGAAAAAARVELDAASASSWHTSDDPQDEWPASLAIDGADQGRGWTVHPAFDKPQALVVRFAKPVKVGGDAALRVTIVQNWGEQHTLGRFRLALSDAPETNLAPPAHLAAVVMKPAEQRTPAEARRLRDFIAASCPDPDGLRAALRDASRRVERLTVDRTFVMGRAAEPRTTRVFNRGSFLSPGDEVTPGVPAVLAPVAGEAPTPDRLGLALWLVDPKNPLTARVQVNRLWSTLFGRGLVETEEDFGTQGEPPTNQPLLDHLAVRFVALGWSQKKLLREIVLSRTYRQSSAVSKTLLDKDPFNKLLARGPRFRVEAEMVRDQALAASGLLSPKMFGESVFPPQPPGVWTMIYSNDQWVESTGEDRWRRGLYTFARRTAPYPTFTSFDSPSREVVCTRRARTNTPLQALTTMNDPQFVEAAGALAVRMLRDGATREARAARGLRLVLGRTPDPAEVGRLTALFDAQLAAYTADPAAAEALVRQNPAPHDGLAAPDLAAWTIVANVILNLDEALTKP